MKIKCAQRVADLWRPSRVRTDDTVAVCGAGRVTWSADRVRPRAVQTGTLWGRGGRTRPGPGVRFRRRGCDDVGVGSVQDFGVAPRETEKLEI